MSSSDEGIWLSWFGLNGMRKGEEGIPDVSKYNPHIVSPQQHLFSYESSSPPALFMNGIKASACSRKKKHSHVPEDSL